MNLRYQSITGFHYMAETEVSLCWVADRGGSADPGKSERVGGGGGGREGL